MKYGLLIFLIVAFSAAGQHLFFKGQATGWAQSEFTTLSKSQAGFRYLPQLDTGLPMGDNLLDAAVAWNLSGVQDWQTDTLDLKADPYRLWARYSSRQFELRLGLQKINFGSALILRPLMWFDQLDPRDVTRFTTGVWGALMRYYLLNNANVWVWGLYGNNEVKGLEWLPTEDKTPEFGGRVQLPLLGGEAAVTFHHRQADIQKIPLPDGWSIPHIVMPGSAPEYRMGVDGKWDVGIGLWLESALVMKEERYAKSGRLLKTTTVQELEKIDGRWLATRARFKDQLKNGNGTVFSIDAIEFNEPIESFRFSKAALKK